MKKFVFHLQMGHALIHYASSNYPLTIIITEIVSSCQSLAFNIPSSELFTFSVSTHNTFETSYTCKVFIFNMSWSSTSKQFYKLEWKF